MIDHLRDSWDALTPSNKSILLKWGSAGLLLLLILFSYYFSGRDQKQAEVITVPNRMDLGTEMLEEDIRAEVDARLDAQAQVNEDDELRQALAVSVKRCRQKLMHRCHPVSWSERRQYHFRHRFPVPGLAAPSFRVSGTRHLVCLITLP